ncbi:NAD(P)H-dependent oxidoreductase [Corallococcus interemptor]|uniref:NAD(P)H-dependent oxidoreductase n=1 Tax=Corallococcus interemptor TaxID=2316720 RepID=UPI003D063950
MNVLIVYAHPEPRSLNGALKDLAVRHLTARGHVVQVSDLYAMNWKATADGADFLTANAQERLFYERESKAAFANGTQTADITAEQRKLLWADAVILQFPLWWFSMPAILKGWVDRVFALGFAYGVGVHGGDRWGDRYGEGTLMGRRAMLSVTIGGRAPHYSERGVNGALDDLLFPIHHGVLFYPGMDVLPPFVTYQSDRLKDEQWPAVEDAFKARLDGLFTDAVIPFRRQNSGHYDTQQVLLPGLGDGASGTRIHLVRQGDPEQRPVTPSGGSPA